MADADFLPTDERMLDLAQALDAADFKQVQDGLVHGLVKNWLTEHFMELMDQCMRDLADLIPDRQDRFMVTRRVIAAIRGLEPS